MSLNCIIHLKIPPRVESVETFLVDLVLELVQEHQQRRVSIHVVAVCVCVWGRERERERERENKCDTDSVVFPSM